ncbi:MAG: Amuc_1098 family type IV pilus outer membrane protein [Akkermansiaceae bacterium]
MFFVAPCLSAESSAVQDELNRRVENARKAHNLLESGDTAYQKADYDQAAGDYAQAFALLPGGTISQQLRSTAANRYATATTEHCRALAKNGRYDEARILLDEVLKPKIAPSHEAALELRRQLDDPIRHNPALTQSHVDDVVKVVNLLRKAEGEYQLGQYDPAHLTYQAVLRLDPYNKAARRGMERISAIKSDYYRAARDQTKATMLAEVDSNWKLYVPAAENINAIPPLESASSSKADVRDKLAGIIVEDIDIEDQSLRESLDFVRLQSQMGDAPDSSGNQTGINIVLNTGETSSNSAKAIANSRVNINAQNLPLSVLLDYITEQTRTQWRVDGMSVVVAPIGALNEDLIFRTFRVPPNFLQAATASSDNLDDDPFGSDDSSEGKLPQRTSITDFLKQNGISFPEGAAASYSAANNTLMVRNSSDNIDLVDQLVSIVTNQEPVMVIIKTAIIRVSEEKLKELGFDWAITPLDLGAGTIISGGSSGNGGALNPLEGNPITSGNRSGNSAIVQDAIQSFLNKTSGITSDSTQRAPGILRLSAITNGMVIDMMMRGLNQSKAADIMVKPSTITRSGERSTIEVIREFIYPTEYEPPELPQQIGGVVSSLNDDENTGGGSNEIFPVTSATPTGFETRNVGISLEVEPVVSANKKYIELSLRPELVEFEGFVNYGSPISALSTDQLGNPVSFSITQNSILMPIFKTIRMPNAALTIQDGSTVVLGGLITSKKIKVEDKTPILGDIPFAGRLFRSEASQEVREAIIVTVNAELVDPTGQPWRKR